MSLELSSPQPVGFLVQHERKEISNNLGRNLLDSFALVFAQPKSPGVIATALELGANERFTLHVARNEGHFGELHDLKTKIESYFNKGSEKKPDKDVRLYILQNCCQSICKSTLELGWSGRKFTPREFQDSLERVRDKRNHKHQKVAQLLVKVFEEVIKLPKLMDKYVTNRDTTTIDLPGEAKTPSVLPEELRKFLNNVTTLSFEVLESHQEAVNDLWNNWVGEHKTNGKTKMDNQYPESGIKVLRLVYSLANYGRAYYDIRRFKEDHPKSKLDINFLGESAHGTERSFKTKKCIIERAKTMGIRSPTDDRLNGSFTSAECVDCHANAFKPCDCPYKGSMENVEWPPDEKACARCWALAVDLTMNEPRMELWTHCEMQVLEMLLDRPSQSDFFDYIGCNKGPCWLCYHTLINMTKNFQMRKPHLKICATWDPPAFKNNPKSRERCLEVLSALGEEMKRLAKIEPTPKSIPSQPDCPGDTNQFHSPRTRSQPLDRKFH